MKRLLLAFVVALGLLGSSVQAGAQHQFPNTWYKHQGMSNGYHGVAVTRYESGIAEDMPTLGTACTVWFSSSSGGGGHYQAVSQLGFANNEQIVQGTVNQCGNGPNGQATLRGWFGGAWIASGGSFVYWAGYFIQIYGTTGHTHWVRRINATQWQLNIDGNQMALANWSGAIGTHAYSGQRWVTPGAGRNHTWHFDVRVMDHVGNWYDWQWPSTSAKGGSECQYWTNPDTHYMRRDGLAC